MTIQERTRQQLDPVGSLGSRPFALLLVGAAFVSAVATTLRSAEQISSPPIAVLALVWLLGACLVVVVGTSSRRGPFSHASHTIMHLLALGSIALSVASQWGLNHAVQDDFGPAALALLVLAVGPYRPASEIAGAGTLSAIFVGFIGLLQVPTFESATPPVAFVIASVAPLLAATFASATYSGSLVSSLERWRATATRLAETRNHHLLDGIARSVQQDRVTVLGRDVLPFFSELLKRDTVTEDDRVRAREIADSIRTIMVAEADRSWLELLLRPGGSMGPAVKATFIDARGCASSMLSEQRTALRAMIVALSDDPDFRPESLRIELRPVDDECRGTLSARIGGTENLNRSRFLPYVALMRMTFEDVEADFGPSTLALEFSYEQR